MIFFSFERIYFNAMRNCFVLTIMFFMFFSELQAETTPKANQTSTDLEREQPLLEKYKNAFYKNHLALDSLFLALELKENSGIERLEFFQLKSRFLASKKQSDTMISNYLKQHLSSDKALLYYTEQLIYQGLQVSDDLQLKLIQIIENTTSEETLRYANFILGHHYSSQKEYDLAITYFQYALNKVDRSVDELAIRSMIQLGRCYDLLSKYQLAFEMFQKANKSAIDQQMNYYLCESLNYLGNVQLDIGNKGLALDYYEKTYKEARAIHAPRFIALGLANKGYVQMQNDDPKSAITNYQRALVNLYNLGDQLTIGRVQKRLGKAYFMFRNYNLARESYLLSLSYFETLKDTTFLARIHFSFAELEFELENFIKAKAHVEKSIALHRKSGSLFGLSDAYRLLAQILASKNKFQQAYLNLERATKLKDSLETTRTQNKIAELNLLYQSEQKERIISQQQIDMEEQKKKTLLKDKEIENRSLRIRQMIFVLLLLVFTFVSFGFWYKNRTKQEKLNLLQRETELRQLVLRAQMNPHFIFNALSVIQGYIFDNDKASSSQFLANFSRLMRLILENSHKEFISLKTELEIMERYMKVQQLRFEQRFEYTIFDNSSIFKEKIGVPPMLLQPFLENAIEHGQLDKEEHGEIKINYKIKEKLIIFTIEDNGIGISHSGTTKRKDHESMAISITKDRISLLHKKLNTHGDLKIEDLSNNGGKGTRITIEVPFEHLSNAKQ